MTFLLHPMNAAYLLPQIALAGLTSHALSLAASSMRGFWADAELKTDEGENDLAALPVPVEEVTSVGPLAVPPAGSLPA